jgi:hypothetical protein
MSGLLWVLILTSLGYLLGKTPVFLKYEDQLMTGKPGDGRKQRAHKGDEAADQQRREAMLMKQVMRRPLSVL